MTRPVCDDANPEENAGAPMPDPWAPGEEPAPQEGPTVLAAQEVTADGELGAGAEPGDAA